MPAALEVFNKIARDIPPPLELECLKALWTMGEGNVKDVRRALAANRNLAYTTVMTVLDRLARKGGVARRKVGRSFVYVPVLRRENLRRLAIQDLVDRFFDGSEDALIAYLRNGHSSPVVRESVDDEVRLDAALL
jgi:predicted transcriptional regulator